MKDKLLFYSAYEDFYRSIGSSKAFSSYCLDAFGADFSQDGFSDLSQINFLFNYIPQSPDIHILDIGCGNGKMLNYIQSKLHCYIHGFDYSDNAINSANKNEKSNFRVGVIGEIEYPPESFDVIISMDTMYFAKDMASFVAQIKTWLKPEGVFLCGYQEGDIMEKTADENTSVLARALKASDMNFEAVDFTEEVYYLLKKKKESILSHKKEFKEEKLCLWYMTVLHQTKPSNVSLDKFKERNSRYIYIAKKH